MPGSSVVFNIYPDMTPVTTPLTETVDPDAVAVPNTTPITVTLQEWGNAVQVTRKLRLFSLSDIDPAPFHGQGASGLRMLLQIWLPITWLIRLTVRLWQLLRQVPTSFVKTLARLSLLVAPLLRFSQRTLSSLVMPVLW